MVTVDEQLYEKMPPEIKAHFKALPNASREEVVGVFPETKSGAMNGVYKNTLMRGEPGKRNGKEIHLYQEASSGSAARFFYVAKASREERNMGLEGFEEIKKGSNFGNDGARPHTKPEYHYEGKTKNHHPTVKPLALMEYLVKLISKKGQTIIDPFMGSGTTGMACKKLEREFIGIEREEEYMKIAEARIEAVKVPKTLF